MDLLRVINTNRYVAEALELSRAYQKQKLYISAGAIAQTVWNSLFNFDPTYGIDDIDIIYWDDSDLSETYENAIYTDVYSLLGDIPIKLDIKNEARVHIWYENKFGYPISPIQSVNDAISRFPTTATAIGIHKTADSDYEIIHPYGMNDLFNGIVRANKKQITRDIYNNKVQKWINKWPKLQVIQW